MKSVRNVLFCAALLGVCATQSGCTPARAETSADGGTSASTPSSTPPATETRRKLPKLRYTAPRCVSYRNPYPWCAGYNNP